MDLARLWGSLSIAIRWQHHHRNNYGEYGFAEQNLQDVKEGINYSIIFNLAAITDGNLDVKSRLIIQVN